MQEVQATAEKVPEKPKVIRVKCDECNGSGYDPDEPDSTCWWCEGDGYNLVETEAALAAILTPPPSPPPSPPETPQPPAASREPDQAPR